MVEGDEGFDPGLEQPVGQPVIEIEPGRVDRTPPRGQDARPGNREAVGVEPQLTHQPDVLSPAVVVVAGHVAGVAVLDLARRVAEAVPDALALAVFVRRALDLVRRRRRPPQEIGRPRARIVRRHGVAPSLVVSC